MNGSQLIINGMIFLLYINVKSAIIIGIKEIILFLRVMRMSKVFSVRLNLEEQAKYKIADNKQLKLCLKVLKTKNDYINRLEEIIIHMANNEITEEDFKYVYNIRRAPSSNEGER
jgi:hypothetical protein